ncbi:MAG: response regulator transcription factor [Chloroflexota bacterium]
MIRVLIVDDQEVVRKGLEIILRHSDGIEVVGVAADGIQAVQKATQLQPDVVLMDLKMPKMNGIHATRRITQQTAERIPKVVVLTTFDGDDWVFEAIRAGATGYLLKDADGAEIAQAVRDAVEGKARLDPSVASKILLAFNQQETSPKHQGTPLQRDGDRVQFEQLTERELSILQLMVQGMTNQEIAQSLFLAQGTVKNNVSNILRKLHSNDRTQAVLAALRAGVVTL